MTFILGSHCIDGVVLVADRKVTIGEGEDYDECDKLFGEIGHVIYGSSGDAEMFELFRGYIMDYINTHPVEINYQNVILKLSQLVFKISKEYNFDIRFLYDVIVAIHPPDKPSTLHQISFHGTPYTVKDYVVMGSGSRYSQVFLKKWCNDKMTMEQVAELGYFIIKYIEDFRLNFTVGGEPMIWFIPDDEKDENGNKIDYKLMERKPEKYAQIRARAIERFNKHEKHLTELSKWPDS